MFEVWYKQFEEREWLLYDTYPDEYRANLFLSRLVYDGYEAKIVKK